ncbi:hypothetical protein AGMMS50256_27080 [Betaproteobacteria bacterium]|nr:hypothetical protein AGMMS50256_27080 [Betaproteobacteria bacterium]
MDDGIEFNEAAFRHDVSEEDIRWAAMHSLYEDLLEGCSNKYLVLGYDDTKRRLLEIMYNRIDDDTVNVFHAMKCTKKYLPLVGF